MSAQSVVHDWSNAVYSWDDVARYGLTIEIVNDYLKSLLGNYNFYTELGNADTIKFWVPRKLTEQEKNELKSKGHRS